MRASDAELEQTVELLRRHLSEGRLTMEELAERSEEAFASTHRADLARLVADLPPPRSL